LDFPPGSLLIASTHFLESKDNFFGEEKQLEVSCGRKSMLLL
jgi:hypothetical protein